MTRIICMASGKGGVGKTMLTANLGAALAEKGKDVIAIDANLTTPNLGLHYGVPLSPITLHDVLKGEASVYDAIHHHERGVKVIPAGISIRDLRGSDVRGLPNAILELLGTADIILMDSSAGLGKEALAAIETGDEMILVVNPEISSVTDALKALKIAQEIGTKVRGIVINRVSGKKHQLSRYEILGMLGDLEVLAEIPEDERVQRAIAKRSPVIYRFPKTRASKEIRRLASKIIGEHVEEKRQPWYRRILGG